MMAPLEKVEPDVLNGAIIDMDAIYASSDAPREQKLASLLARSYVRAQRTAWDGALSDAEVVIQYGTASHQHEARFVRAVAFIGLKRWQLADADFTVVMERTDLPNGMLDAAQTNRAYARLQTGDLRGAVSDYSSVLERTDSDDVKAVCFIWRARCSAALGGRNGERSDLWQVTKLRGCGVDSVMFSLVQRALSFREASRFDKEADHYRAIIQSPQAPPLYVAIARNNLAVAETLMNKQESALDGFKAVAEGGAVPPDIQAVAFRNRAVGNLRRGDEAGAMNDMNAALKISGLDSQVELELTEVVSILIKPATERCYFENALLDGLKETSLRGEHPAIIL